MYPPIQMHTEWEWWCKTLLEPEVFWVMFTGVMTFTLVLGTFLLAITSYLPLIRAKQEEIRASKAAFAERLRQELITPASQGIFFMFAHGFLKFHLEDRPGKKSIPYFKIAPVTNDAIKTRLDQIVGGQQVLMTFELDDFILNPLQEAAHYERLGELDFKDLSRIFCEYVAICFQSPEITKYILWMRKIHASWAWRELQEFFRRIEIANGRRREEDGPVLALGR